ncbi:hypothetical protein DCE79_08400 [Lysinibacillus sp. 2017]|uniref:hypothetical protein n=1 Tax=unclassified Lysinibacillus TaxID=2636778 RepID=UPI000D529398|nr:MULTISPECIES: hypothetical protein [unclassified Lysinibacillus]AWE07390.1 hypothetical protein DCE79_08400 [Lysinibacillus sp. 2017]TGN36553.1 hypothetical protein E4L99_03115 [Lysinibacillus sp. S2017]
MKKILFFILAVSLTSVILIGCQSSNSENVIVQIAKVSISKSTGFGKVNSDFFVEYVDQEKLGIFSDAITTASKNVGIADMIDPEYDFTVLDPEGNTEGYHLWLGEKGQLSTLMIVRDTHTTYSISENMTDKLIEVIE